MNRAAPLIGEHVEGVPVELEDLIADLLERDPADRPPSAAAVLQRLDLLGPDSSTEPRRSRLVLVGSIAALGVIGAAAWFGWSRFASPTPEADSPREAPLAGASDLPELPGLPDLTADAEEPAERSDDASLAALEAEAQRALDDLERRARSGTLDAAEWRNVADSFAGTDAARRALDIADDLEGSIAEQVVQTAALTEELDTLRRSLQAAGATLAERLTALQAVPPEDIPLAADRAEAWIADLGRQWVAEADDELTRRVADFESRQEASLFDEAEVAVHEMLAMFRAEESFDPGPLSAEWTRFAQRETEIQERFAGLPAARAAWERARVLGDQEVAARELTGPDSIETDLRNLELERAAERLRALSERLSAAPVTSVLERWAADAEAARAALHLLAVTHRNGLWRRRALPDPRRGRAAEVLDVDDVSMTLEVEGRAERLPWATFARTETLHQLFNGRLERAYTQDERNGIAALMRIAATMELLEATRSALFGTRRSPGAALTSPDLAAAFDRLFEWSDAGPALEAARREARARDLLVRVSGELEREDWSSAAFLLERLLGEHADSWVVLLLSNGKRTEGPVITAAWDSDSESK